MIRQISLTLNHPNAYADSIPLLQKKTAFNPYTRMLCFPSIGSTLPILPYENFDWFQISAICISISRSGLDHHMLNGGTDWMSW